MRGEQSCEAEWKHNMAVLSWSTPCKVLQSSLSQSELWREEAVDFGAQFSKNKALKNRAQVVNKLSLMGLEGSSLCRVSCLNNSLETKGMSEAVAHLTRQELDPTTQ